MCSDRDEPWVCAGDKLSAGVSDADAQAEDSLVAWQHAAPHRLAAPQPCQLRKLRWRARSQAQQSLKLRTAGCTAACRTSQTRSPTAPLAQTAQTAAQRHAAVHQLSQVLRRCVLAGDEPSAAAPEVEGSLVHSSVPHLTDSQPHFLKCSDTVCLQANGQAQQLLKLGIAWRTSACRTSPALCALCPTLSSAQTLCACRE